MAISTTNLSDRTIGMVIVAQDGTGDFNGTTELCIQQAIDSVASGGWIYIKSGTYEISATITVAAHGVKLSGVPNHTILEGQLDITILDITRPACMLQDFTIQGLIAGINANPMLKITAGTVERMIIQGRQHGIEPRLGVNKIRTSTISCAGHIAINIVNAACIANQIINNVSIYGEYGIYIENGNGANTILGNEISSCDYAIYMIEAAHNNIINNNYMYGTKEQSIYLNNCSWNVINGNMITTDADSDGIVLEDTEHNMVIGNMMECYAVSTKTGLKEVGTTDYTLINSNNLTGFNTNFTIIGAATRIGVNGDA